MVGKESDPGGFTKLQHSIFWNQAQLIARERTGRMLLQRLFPAFPGGLPGIALLLFRAVFAVSLMLESRFYLSSAAGVPAVWVVGLAALGAAALLLVGFLTPVAGAVAALEGVAVALSLLPAGKPIVYDSSLDLVLAGAILVGIIVLGPGAFSLDARIFGRREIIIPRATLPP